MISTSEVSEVSEPLRGRPLGFRPAARSQGSGGALRENRLARDKLSSPNMGEPR
jgi:hypothetical protein